MEKGVRDELQLMIDEFESQRLVVTLFPAPNPAFLGHMVRCVIEQNAPWYREYCHDHPSSCRGRYTRIKRFGVLSVLNQLVSRGSSRSKYAVELVEVAKARCQRNADPF
jgi:hypothetical protein